MKNKIIKKKFLELVKKAKIIENKCDKNTIDFIETPYSHKLFLNSQYYHILNT